MTLFAIVFHGQGAQKLGMLADLAVRHKIVKETFAEASIILGYDLWQLVQSGPTNELNKTCKTQPALLASSVAIWRIWRQQGGKIPAMMAGHSLGEYSALVCSGVLDFSAAIKLVELRGRLMQEAVPSGTGGMSVIIGLDNQTISHVCKKVSNGQVVSLVNLNTPTQVVIAGHKEAVDRAVIACQKAGAQRVLPLPISVPSHCVLMKPIANKLALALENISFYFPNIPVINNVDVRSETDPCAIKQALIRQLYSPVRWEETVKYLAEHHIKLVLEMGPSKVLTGLTKRIVANMGSIAVYDQKSLELATK